MTRARNKSRLVDANTRDVAGLSVVTWSVPSWANRIRVTWDGVTISAQQNSGVRLGVGGVVKPDGYTGSVTRIGASTLATDVLSGTHWVPYTAAQAGAKMSGEFVLTRSSGNRWVETSMLGREEAAVVYLHGGSNEFSGVVDTLLIEILNGATYTAGTMTAMFEA
jgi:hypothetical protein